MSMKRRKASVLVVVVVVGLVEVLEGGDWRGSRAALMDIHLLQGSRISMAVPLLGQPGAWEGLGFSDSR